MHGMCGAGGVGGGDGVDGTSRQNANKNKNYRRNSGRIFRFYFSSSSHSSSITLSLASSNPLDRAVCVCVCESISDQMKIITRKCCAQAHSQAQTHTTGRKVSRMREEDSLKKKSPTHTTDKTEWGEGGNWSRVCVFVCVMCSVFISMVDCGCDASMELASVLSLSFSTPEHSCFFKPSTARRTQRKMSERARAHAHQGKNVAFKTYNEIRLSFAISFSFYVSAFRSKT